MVTLAINSISFNVDANSLVEGGGAVLPVGAVAEGQFLKRSGASIVGAAAPSGGSLVEHVVRIADGAPMTDTSWTPDPILRRALMANEALYFEWWILFTSGVDADLKVGLLFPVGAEYWFATHSNVKCAPNETAVRNVVATTLGDYFEVAGHGATPMVVTLVGVVRNGATPGNMQLRAGQYVSIAPQPAVIKANSILRVWPL